MKNLEARITKIEQHQQTLKRYFLSIKQQVDDLTQEFHNRSELQDIEDIKLQLDLISRQLKPLESEDQWLFNEDSLNGNQLILETDHNNHHHISQPLINRETFLKRYHDGERDFQGVNLRNADLSGLSLREVNFQRADFKGANLNNIDFGSVDLREANLEETQLRGSILYQVTCNNASFFKADFYQANIKLSKLKNTNFQQTNLVQATLEDNTVTDANFSKANLKNATLKNVIFDHSNLTGANLIGALVIGSFQDVNLTEAKLAGANCDLTNFRNAILISADLRGTYLATANLSQANLKNANLSRAILKHGENKVNLTGAILPDGNIKSES
jgi:uncharacterized protein YjbI with pentapeptide repeats